MQLLVFLRRFELELDLVVKKISKLGTNVEIEKEDSLLVINGDNLDTKKIIELIEVERVLEVVSPWTSLNSYTLREEGAKAFDKLGNKKYKIFVRINSVFDISSKSIYKQINSVAAGYSEENYEGVMYIEVIKKYGKKYFRLSICYRQEWEREVAAFNYPFLIVLENPTLVSEVSDFLRICWVFKVSLMLVGNVDPSIIDKAKAETKNIPREFEVKINKSLPKDYTKIGFSKHAGLGEEELIKNIKKGNYALIFGNEKFGLSQKARDECDYLIRLGSEVNKPLRASQALSFVLGIYRALK